MSNHLPQPTSAAKPDISELVTDIVDGKLSLFDLIRSPQDGDYRAHVEMMRAFSAITTDRRALKILLREPEQKIADHENKGRDSEEIEKQVLRNDGTVYRYF
jgi:hypothetical protein